jgi:hypothetical protein
MQCDECSYYKGRCTNLEIPDNAEELAKTGECPGFAGGTDEAEIMFAEKG